jgi:hypothetical protein
MLKRIAVTRSREVACVCNALEVVSILREDFSCFLLTSHVRRALMFFNMKIKQKMLTEVVDLGL